MEEVPEDDLRASVLEKMVASISTCLSRRKTTKEETRAKDRDLLATSCL